MSQDFDNFLEFVDQQVSDYDCIVDIFTLSVIWVNASLSELTGFSKENLVGLKILELINPGEKNYQILAMKLMRGEFTEEGFIIKKDGSQKGIRAKITPIKYGDHLYATAKIL